MKKKDQEKWKVNFSTTAPFKSKQVFAKPIYALHFSTHRRHEQLVVASSNGAMALIDSISGEEIWRIQAHAANINVCAFSPDETKIMTCSDDRSTKIWDTKTGSNLAVLNRSAAFVLRGSWAHDSRFILTSHYDFSVQIWDVDTKTMVLRIPQDGICYAACFSSHHNLIFTAHRWGMMSLFSYTMTKIKTNSLEQQALTKSGQTAHIDTTTNINHAHSSNINNNDDPNTTNINKTNLNDANAIPQLADIEPLEEPPQPEFRGSYQLLDSALFMLRPNDYFRSSVFLEDFRFLGDLVSPPALKVVTGSDQGWLEMRDVSKQRLQLDWSVRAHAGWIQDLKVVQNKILLSCSEHDGIKIWDIKSKSELAILQSLSGVFNSSTINRDFSKIAASSARGAIGIYPCCDPYRAQNLLLICCSREFDENSFWSWKRLPEEVFLRILEFAKFLM